MISIITIVLNSSKLFERTVKSIANQTCKNFEYIVIDGGSTDGTVDIIKLYENHIDHWYSSQDKGISDAFNKGIEKSSGNIIGILNAGDLFNMNTIEVVGNSFIDGVDYIYGQSILKKEDGQTVKVIVPSKINGFPYQGMPFQHSALFVRKKVFDCIGGYNLDYQTTMDFELLLRILGAGYKGRYVDQVLSTYFRGGVSDKNYIKGYIEVLIASLSHNKNYFKILISFIYGISKTSVRRLFS